MTARDLIALAAADGRSEHEGIVVLADPEAFAVLTRRTNGVMHGLHGMDAARATQLVETLLRARPTDAVYDAYLATVRAGLDLGPPREGAL